MQWFNNTIVSEQQIDDHYAESMRSLFLLHLPKFQWRQMKVMIVALVKRKRFEREDALIISVVFKDVTTRLIENENFPGRDISVSFSGIQSEKKKMFIM